MDGGKLLFRPKKFTKDRILADLIEPTKVANLGCNNVLSMTYSPSYDLRTYHLLISR